MGLRKMIRLIRGGLLLPAAWIASLYWQKKTEEEAYQACRKWSKRALRLLGYRIRSTGTECLPTDCARGLLLVCNHQGTLDPALIAAVCPVPLHFISKQENVNIPVMGRWARNIGTIHFDRTSQKGNISMLRSAMRVLKKGQWVLLFPEGHRSKGEQMRPFKEKSLQLALMAKADIMPIGIHNAWDLDTPAMKEKILSISWGPVIPYDRYKGWDEAVLRDYMEEQVKSMTEKAAELDPDSFFSLCQNKRQSALES